MTEEQIEQAIVEIEKLEFPTVDFDEWGPSEKYDGVYYSRGIGEIEGQELDVTIYFNPETSDWDVLIEEVEK